MQFLNHLKLCALTASMLLAACGGGDDAPVPVEPEEARAQDARVFTPLALTSYPDFETGTGGAPSFRATTGVPGATSRWTGLLENNGRMAAFRIEVPQTWNGKLVMYAHGFVAVTTTTLAVQYSTPSITALRRAALNAGFAFAASSYSTNAYDVRQGLEDTNKLALSFTQIAAQNGRTLAAPTRTYIIGHSLGGHVTAAAVEAETMATANNKVRYDGALPMCAVLGDSELFDYFAAYQLAAQKLAGPSFEATAFPATNFAAMAANVRAALFTVPAGSMNPPFDAPTAQGVKLRDVVKNLTGGERPIFLQGFNNAGVHNLAWGTFGGSGDITGILNKNGIDTNRFVYRFDAPDAEIQAFNTSIVRSTPQADANRLRRDGLRWIPKVLGQPMVPVLTLHGLGDMFVPFHMEQIYNARVKAQGRDGMVVQRALRANGHCDYTAAEQTTAFFDMVNWVENGVKPMGDDVITPATLANANYGCRFSTAPDPVAEAGLKAVRDTFPACTN